MMRPLLSLLLAVGAVAVSAPAQPPGSAWGGYARDPQHTAISPVAAQPLKRIKWTAPLDLRPQYAGNDLLIHYGSPVVTAENNVIFPVKTADSNPGTGDVRFRVEARRGADGSVLWRMDTGYVFPPHNWTPSFGITLTPNNHLYFPGVGGTVQYRASADRIKSSVGSLVFYGKNNYYADMANYNDKVRICTPITSDKNGNLYFGYYVTGDTKLGLKSGIARLSYTGVGTYVSATTAANDASITQVSFNCAPALSNDGKTVYIAVRRPNSTGYLLALDSKTLATSNKVALQNPLGNGPGYLLNDGTSSPTVGPDGDVYFGVWDSWQTHFRGWLLHFNANLSVTKIPGGFGWDDTPAIVPASMVPSYTGRSSYLVMTKYNNYAGGGGDGVNLLAVLDPNDTGTLPFNGATVMKEVLTVKGATPDTEFLGSHPDAVREWCINTAAIDPATKSIIVNSEDGKAYRWDMVTNKLVDTLKLTEGIGEAYTPTVIGPDGTSYAINNATLFALGE